VPLSSVWTRLQPLILPSAKLDSGFQGTVFSYGDFEMIIRIFAAIAAAFIALHLGSLPSSAADKRVALVIGNGNYQKAAKLPNPTNDAMSIAGMLKAAGFDEVALHENLGIREMRQAINDFADTARDSDVAVVYYSGHGIEVNGVNYLIPVDAVLNRDSDVPYETVSLDNLVQLLEPARRLRLVMLDACRDNPFTRSMKRSAGTRSASRGLAAVEPTSANTVIAFAAKAGSFALDGNEHNSPYATAILNNLATPGLELRLGFGRVRDEVLKVTKNKQEPFLYGSLGGAEIFIFPGTSDGRPQAPASTPLTPVDRAGQVWMVTKDTTSVAVLEDFIRQFGNTPYGSMARARLEEIRKSKVAAIPPSQRPTEQTTQSQSSTSNDQSVLGRWRYTARCGSVGTVTGSFQLSGSPQRMTGSISQDQAFNQPLYSRSITDGHLSGSTVVFTDHMVVMLGTFNHIWTGTLSGPGRMTGQIAATVETCTFTATR
jgi:hypothetical protein